MSTRKIIFMTLSAILLIGFIYGLFYELYVIGSRPVMLLFVLLIIADVIVFVKLFWNITANHNDDA